MRKYLMIASAIITVASPQFAQAQAGKPPVSFATCGVCHKIKAGEKSTLGPNLFKVAGRRAGTLPGYSYSPAMQKSGIVWSRASLTDFLKSPSRKVPGTKMGFAGHTDPRKTDEIVTYLLGLK
ncbi:c-type cytochrome [Sphingobium sp.]|uniref:c-type cytochrome n=1 Tax=Sphingobium sp. TaxID=1912891 RepID=UPI003BB544BF